MGTIIWIIGVGLPIAALIYLFGWLVGFNVSCQMTNWGTGFDDGWKAHEELTVGVVPLDKLCGILSKFVGNPPCPCGYDLKGTGCNPDWTRKDCWKIALTTWMEENE